jgi:tape measure domain-containing protein
MTIQTELELKTKATGSSKAQKELDGISKSIGGISKEAKSLLKIMGVAGVGAGFIKLGKSALVAAAGFEQTQVAFRTMIGDVKTADLLLRGMAAFAAKTPFTLQGVEQNAKLLQAMGISVKELLPTMRMLGDVSAGLSVPLENIALAYGQVRAANQLYGTELRQFVNNGVPLLSELASNFGKTERQVKKMVEEGQVGFTDVRDAFKSMTAEGGKFHNLMKEQAKTFNGMVSNLKDVFTLFLREAGKDYLDFAKEVVAGLTSFTQTELPKILGTTKAFAETMFSVLHSAASGIGQTWSVLMGVFSKETGAGLISATNAFRSFVDIIILGVKAAEVAIKSLGVMIGEGIAQAKKKFTVKNIALTLVPIPGIGHIVDQFSEANDEMVSSTESAKEEIGALGQELIDLYASIETNNKKRLVAQSTDWEKYQKELEEMLGDIEGDLTNSGLDNKTVAKNKSNLLKLTKDFRTARSSIKDSMEKLAADHEKNMAKINENIAETEEKLKDLNKEFTNLQKEQSQDYASEVIAQQEKIAETEEELNKERHKKGKEQDINRINELKRTLNSERRALEESQEYLTELKIQDKDFALQIEGEITEAKRRARQTDFTNFIEDFKSKRKTSLEEFEKDKDILNKKLEAFKKELDDEEKYHKIAVGRMKGRMNSLNAVYRNVMQKNTETTRVEIEHQITFFNRLKKAAKEALSATQALGGGGGGTFGGARANGGPVSAGKTYLVGEKEAELFTPRTSGTIIPGSRLGGKTGTIINNNFSGVFGTDAAEEILDLAVQKLAGYVAI